jgi:MFS family permease
MDHLIRNRQYVKFSSYGFLKNLRFFDAFLILYLVEKGLPYTQIGVLYAIREIAINVSEIPSGIVADTIGRKKSLVGSFLIYILSFLFYYLARDFWMFLPAFLLFGVADAFRSGTHKGMIMEYLRLNQWEDQKINYYGHTRSWSQMGSALSSLLAGIIVFYTGSYRYIFLFSIIPYLLNMMLILSYPRELDQYVERINPRHVPGLRRTLRQFMLVIRKPRVLEITNASAIHSAFLTAVKDYIQPLMAHVALLIPWVLHLDAEKRNGIVIGILYFFIYILTSFASREASRVETKNKHRVIYGTLLIGFMFGAVCGALYLKEFWIVSLVAFVGIYLVENLRKPILTGFIADQVPNEILTSVISAQSFLKTVITALLALGFGIVADHIGIGGSLLAVSLFLTLITFFIHTKARKQRKWGFIE